MDNLLRGYILRRADGSSGEKRGVKKWKPVDGEGEGEPI